MTYQTKHQFNHSTHCAQCGKTTKTLALFPLFLALIISSFAVIATSNSTIAKASGFEDMIDEDFISFYEDKIAGSPIITNMDKKVFSDMQSRYGLTENRLTMLLVLEHFGGLVNQPKTIDKLTKMSDNQLISYAKRLIALYSKNLDDTQKEALKDDFLALLKRKSQQQNNLD
ncbi:MAG: hypothetical protein J6Q06_04155 [Clostridia bacterium]|nr:hypothetical protein [Clostridia bacterium]